MSEEGVRVQPGFYRAHGLGNDYLVFEARGTGAQAGTPFDPASSDPASWPLTPTAIRAICRRWWGLGSDGIVVLMEGRPGPHAPFPLRMFNPDGSEFERSGNGLRILASFLYRSGRIDTTPFPVKSGGSVIGMQVHGPPRQGVFDVSVQMGRARVGPEAVALDARRLGDAGGLDHPRYGQVDFQPVSVGNPHAVVFTDDLSEEALEQVGPFLTDHPAFGSGTNVQLARVEGEGELRIAIWERGVGRTSASGTSACAAAVAAVHGGRLDAGDIRVRMEGGTLKVTVSADLHVILRGPVQEVATGRLAAGFVEGLSGQGAPEG